jgi:hypothetical protein
MKGMTFGKDRIIIKDGDLTVLDTTVRNLRMMARLQGGTFHIFQQARILDLNITYDMRQKPKDAL